MRPIELRLRGLHSFREQQVLDFRRVTDAGVFGIFGPTGSGKSTVLDAITLALYGRVVRAKGGTQGILNHAEQRLEVAFTFELADPAGPRRYRAERSYVRAGDNAVRASSCRLVAVGPDGGATVLADSAPAVTERVTELLGLTAEDFTRAVVLPQGKFAEFLHLTGAERRRMLQRIFGLEPYGDLLAAQVKARLEAVRLELEGVSERQRELGDASDDAVAGAEAALQEAAARAERARRDRQQVEAEFARWQEVWEWQRQLREVERQEAALAAEESAALQADAELQAARRAERVRPYLDAARSAAAALADAGARLERAEQAAREGEAAAEAAAAALEEARARRAREQPRLQEQRVRLADAVELEARVRALGADLAEAARQLEEARAQEQAASERLAALQAEMETARREHEAAAGRLEAAQVDPAHRARVNEALSALREYRRALEEIGRRREALESAQRERDRAQAAALEAALRAEEAEQALRRAREALEAARQQPHESDEDLTAEARWLERTRGQVADYRRAAEAYAQARAEAGELAAAAVEARRAVEAAGGRLQAAVEALEAAEEALRQARERREAAQRQALAAALARGLAAGTPCPVCGSTHHPAPATGGEALEEADARVAAAEAERARAQAAADAARAGEAAARQALAGAEQRAAETAARAERLRAELDAATAALPPPWREAAAVPDPDGLEARLRAQEQEFERRQRALSEWKEAVERLQREADDLAREARRVGEAASDRAVQAAAAMARFDEAERALHEAEAAAAGRRQAFDRIRGDLAEDAVESEAQAVARRDEEARRLSRELTRLAARIGEAGDAIRQLQVRLDELRRAVAERAAAHGRIAEERRALEERLLSVTAGQRAADLLAQVEAALDALEAEERAREAAAREAQERLQAARQAEAGLRSERETLARREQEAAAELAQALAGSGFASADSAQAALRAPEVQAELERRVERFREEARRLRLERQRLEQALGGRHLTDEEWAAWEARLQHAREGELTAREAWGAARTACADLKERNARWKALEARRAELARLLGHLEDLQGVLRGGAFVEFMAEEQLRSVALDASARLGQLTRFRYALEVDSAGGFRIRDDHNGGVRRPVSSLSGGETFLTSLALALALSGQIQLRGQYPLQFFFLDEGFGTLDPELLETVMLALERLRLENVNIGVISHVPELRARLSRRVLVEPAEPGGRGSQLRVEIA